MFLRIGHLSHYPTVQVSQQYNWMIQTYGFKNVFLIPHSIFDNNRLFFLKKIAFRLHFPCNNPTQVREFTH